MDFYPGWERIGLPLFNGKEPIWWYSPTGLRGVSDTRLNSGFERFFKKAEKEGMCDATSMRPLSKDDFFSWDLVSDDAISGVIRGV